MRRAVVLALLLSPLAFACQGPPAPGAHGQGETTTAAASAGPLQKVASIHGGAGPWAVLGYRMGVFALEKLALKPGSFDLDVKHESPRTPQFACVADGAQAATGASLGKVNLSLVEADEAHVQTTYKKKSTGQTLTLKPTQAFRDRFKDVPREKLGEAGAQVLDLPNDALFEEVK